MKKFVLFLCALGFVFLAAGSVLVVGAAFVNSITIQCSGIIGARPEESQSEQASEPQLDKVGYVAVLISVGFFAAAFLPNRKSST